MLPAYILILAALYAFAPSEVVFYASIAASLFKCLHRSLTNVSRISESILNFVVPGNELKLENSGLFNNSFSKAWPSSSAVFDLSRSWGNLSFYGGSLKLISGFS